jgi:hypothetical protein
MAYTEQQIEKAFNDICTKICGGSSLRATLCFDNTPSSQTFYKWIDEDKEKAKQYARACEERTDYIFEDLITISDSAGGDLITLPDGREVVDNAVITRDRLRVDTRKWMLSKLNPKKYGDKLDVTQTINDTRKTVEDLFPSDNELDEQEDKS